MNRASWIARQIFADVKNNLGWLFKGVLIAGGFIGGIKLLTFFNLPEEIAFPILWIAFILVMIYKWYSMKYDWSKQDKSYERASRKYQKALKGGR